MATTYRKLAQIIRDTYYKGMPNDDANFGERYFAELIAQEVANMAVADAYNNSNLGEATYSNDQFISVFKNLPIVKDGDEKYVELPATPAGLPKNREIVDVKVTGSKCISAVPYRNYASFSQSLLGIPFGLTLYKIEDGKIVFKTKNPLLSGTVTIKMVGAVSGDTLLDSDLNIPKDAESKIITKILSVIMPLKAIPQDLINDSISIPS